MQAATPLIIMVKAPNAIPTTSFFFETHNDQGFDLFMSLVIEMASHGMFVALVD